MGKLKLAIAALAVFQLVQLLVLWDLLDNVWKVAHNPNHVLTDLMDLGDTGWGSPMKWLLVCLGAAVGIALCYALVPRREKSSP